MNPLVSICVPTYNSSRFLRQCLDSLVAQSYKNIEVIISDNASTDDTIEIARGYAERYGFTVLVNASNIGALPNWNSLVNASNGEYVAIYHSDDVYEPTIVQESLAVLRRSNNIVLVGTMARTIDSRGDFLYEYELPREIKKLGRASFSFDEVMLGVMRSGGTEVFFVTPSLMAKREVYKELGLFDEGYRSSGDYEMWLRMAAKYDVTIIEKPLLNYRVHEQQGSELELRRNVELPDIVQVIREYEKYIKGYRIKKLCRETIDRHIVKTAIKQNCRRLFVKSSETLRATGTWKYIIPKYCVLVANRLHVKLKSRWITA